MKFALFDTFLGDLPLDAKLPDDFCKNRQTGSRLKVERAAIY